MKSAFLVASAGLSLVSALPWTHSSRAQPKGFDISSYQPNVNWNSVKANGAEFVIIKATEGTSYQNKQFSSQYTGATNVGIIRGAYHFAAPSTSSGAAQASYFLAHGGGWSSDGRTLPGMLDIEYNPYGSNKCYGLSTSAMVKWIHDFVDTYSSQTGRPPMIYTTTDWWKTCTGNNGGFGASPLVLARYSSSVGTIPNGWGYETIWQNADSGVFPGDQDVFNGDSAGLKRLAEG